jgi:hypothetical protein
MMSASCAATKVGRRCRAAQTSTRMSSVLLSIRIFNNHEDFGLRWQSTAATPLFDCGPSFQSGVALRFPPQSKKFGYGYAVL